MEGSTTRIKPAEALKTVRAEATAAKQAEKTLRPQTTGRSENSSSSTDFILKGRVYRGIKCLSDNSGEAQVFLVEGDEGERVLKVYYPNFTIKKTLMRIIQNFNMEMVVSVSDYGKTYVDGKNRDYELMEYLRGGTLADYDIDGDINQFRRIALQAAAALAYCHNCNVIHKDIKPGNFFFRNKDHKELVLGDFGISSVMEAGEHAHRTTQARTPVYAAPEMYNDVIDGEVEITPAADYYSLGITLLTLWLGENPLSQNERVMMRKKNEGRLPRLNELPERVKTIIQGLTAVNPQSRWGYDEVERWFLGEDVKVDISSPLLKYRSFVIDPERNIVADNVHELIPLLLDNERLAINYLYSGRIATWLEQSGNVKLSTAVKDITANRYPADQRAGLMAAVYVMEPTHPYRDLQGNICDDVHSIAISVLNHQEEYQLALRNKNNDLFIYLETHTKCDVNRLRSYFSDQQSISPRVALLRFVYEIDNEIPFIARYKSATIRDIVHCFGYENCTDDEWQSLSDGRLLSWMYSHEDNMACEALRIMTQGQEPTKSLGYRVLYNIDRDAAYDLRDADTPYKVGEVMAGQLLDWQELDESEFRKHIADYYENNGRFIYFAQLHGWFEQISQAKACFDLKSEENRERLGAYDMRTAAYRYCRMLGAIPSYMLADGTLLADGTNFDTKSSRPLLLSAMRNGCLSQWMAAFYHENPHLDLSADYSYERSLEEWILRLGEIDPNQTFYRRYGTAKEETAKKYREVQLSYKQARSKEKRWCTICYSLAAVWLLLVAVCGISGRSYVAEHALLTIAIPVGGMTGLIVAVRAFFGGYGFMFSCFWGLLGFLTSWIPILLLRFINGTYPDLFVPAVIVITLIYVLVCKLTDYGGSMHDDNQLMNEVMEDDIKTTLIEPLYYTFKQKSYHFKGSKFGMLDDVNNQVRSISGESVLHYILWSVLFAMLVAEMVLFSPKLLNIKTPDIENFSLSPESVVKQLQKDVE